uniref:Lipid-binding serum glycoprotein N-terminal domain-containing protein n=2 Tax=Panagrolaimus TaxID=55784 RepID=A0A914Y630_9BILA
MVLRFNDKGLHALADYTRLWMNYTIGEMSIDSYSHKIHKGIAAGDLNLQNITVSRFYPPLIRYRSSEHSLYMTTLGGQVELQAEWELESAFLSLFTFPFRGEVLGRIAGLQSEISVQINPSTNEFAIHHCTAKFHDFRIRLSGSMAADILHWFRTILGKAMKRKVEETYCKMISEKLLPWLQYQITKFPGYLEINFGENIKLSQSLHSIAMTNSHIDLRMKNKFITNGHLIETLSTLPTSIPNNGEFLEYIFFLNGSKFHFIKSLCPEITVVKFIIKWNY